MADTYRTMMRRPLFIPCLDESLGTNRKLVVAIRIADLKYLTRNRVALRRDKFEAELLILNNG